MKYRFLVFVLINIVFQAAAQTLEIPFAENKPQIDGNLEEWNMSIDLTDTKQTLQYRNTNHFACLWDNEFLYIAFQIQDACLTENEKGNDNPRLYFNDAVEIYIDTHNDSKEKMDLNDYQFIISLTGESVIFKGDKEQIKEGNSVPKDVGIANIVFKTKTAVHGSINILNDKDDGYNVEIALPWSALGIIPKEKLAFKMDLCVDDIDTVANFKPWPNDYSPPSMHFSNLQKKSDFGFPKDWTRVELTDSPTQLYLLKQTIKENSVIIIIVSALLLALLTVIMIIQYKRIAFMRNMPERKSLFDEEAKPAETKTIASLFPLIQPHQEHIINLKNYIEENIDADISIDQLAAKLHTSTRQLQRIFKEELNLTPKQFITIIKLEKASHLLTNTNKSISEIAFATGFSDPAYFTNVFKRYFGLPPSGFGRK